MTDETSIHRLLALMARLRDPEAGCPWDRDQTFASIAPYTLEEAYEVADAIERHDLDALKDELGDLLFQVVFHAQMAKEAGAFDFADVAATISEKMERRHPHVFGNTMVADAHAQTIAWEELKRQERQQRVETRGTLDGIPAVLPALTRATKLGKRAGTVGFDWPDLGGVVAKVEEELAELREAIAGSESDERVSEELGDLLFALSNLARHRRLDPEQALRHANAKFERRFRHMERELQARGLTPSSVSPAELDQLWESAKAAEQKPG